METKIKLLSYSKGSGCGCKIAPDILQNILSANKGYSTARLLAGPTNNEDAAVYDLLNGDCLISTTDFFLPVVDDAFDFGRVAAANALSDIYAMGGKPVFALGILGWPLDKIPVEQAKQVMAGACEICIQAGIPLAGGHSIESSDPIFGLVVNGLAKKENVIMNSGAKPGDAIYMTKALGLGILSAAMKRGLLEAHDYKEMLSCMITLNKRGSDFAESGMLSAMTDVTGFGFVGHLMEMAKASGCAAIINKADVSVLPIAKKFSQQFVYPDITTRNYNAYAKEVEGMDDLDFLIFCDPQTSGGLLISVHGNAIEKFDQMVDGMALNLYEKPRRIGTWQAQNEGKIIIFR
jgi:selenide, water dikinase